MARPPASYRLQALDPSVVAERAVLAAAERSTLDAPKEPLRSELGRKAMALTAYAQGTGAAESPRELVYEVGRAVFGVEREDPAVPLDSMVGVVLVAARCRAKLSAEPPATVSTKELAALAGVHPSHVRRVAQRSGVDRVARGTISPSSARAYLATLGVAGFGEASPAAPSA
jgi:hypothetical protein